MGKYCLFVIFHNPSLGLTELLDTPLPIRYTIHRNCRIKTHPTDFANSLDYDPELNYVTTGPNPLLPNLNI